MKHREGAADFQPKQIESRIRKENSVKIFARQHSEIKFELLVAK
jgi:hypothetical protein